MRKSSEGIKFFIQKLVLENKRTFTLKCMFFLFCVYVCAYVLYICLNSPAMSFLSFVLFLFLQYVPPDLCICNFVLEQSLSVRALQEMLANTGENASEGVSKLFLFWHQKGYQASNFELFLIFLIPIKDL